LAFEVGPPVGVGPPIVIGTADRHVSSFSFEESDTLLLYSDGLVERRGEDIDEGLHRLVINAGVLVGALDDAAVGALAEELRQAGADDDVTVLAVRPLRSAGPVPGSGAQD
jgi:serine phosphatase RsbU (regulator of sigma subunit)